MDSRFSGIIVAMPSEARAIFSRRRWRRWKGMRVAIIQNKGRHRVICAISGTGFEAAARAAARLVEAGVSELISTGVSGGLAPSLETGSVLVADSVKTWNGSVAEIVYSFSSHGKRRETCPIISFFQMRGYFEHRDSIITVSEPVCSPDEKAMLWKQTGAIAVDMETAGAVAVAGRSGIPFCAVRAICDDSDTAVPDGIAEILDKMGRVRPVALAAACIKTPGLIDRLFVMNRDFRNATGSLKGFWQGVAKELSFSYPLL